MFSACKDVYQTEFKSEKLNYTLTGFSDMKVIVDNEIQYAIASARAGVFIQTVDIQMPENSDKNNYELLDELDMKATILNALNEFVDNEKVNFGFINDSLTTRDFKSKNLTGIYFEGGRDKQKLNYLTGIGYKADNPFKLIHFVISFTDKETDNAYNVLLTSL